MKLIDWLVTCNALVTVMQVLVQASGFGGCPRHDYMKNFNVSRFTGQWYEVERSFYLIELTTTCVTINLQENAKKNLDVTVTSIGRWSRTQKDSQGTAIVSKKNPSIYLYKVKSHLPNIVARFLPGAGYYQVLHTDYDNYAIVWTCTNAAGVAHADLIRILGRKTDLDVKTRTHVYSILADRRIDTDRLTLSNNNCSLVDY